MSDQSSKTLIKNRCPHCGTAVKGEVHLAGDMVTCPNPRCGRPFRMDAPEGEPAAADAVARRVTDTQVGESGAPGRVASETDLFNVHPAIFRRRPLQSLGMLAVVLVALLLLTAGASARFEWGWFQTDVNVPAGVMLIAGGVLLLASVLVLLWWWLEALYTTVRVTNKRTTFKEGIISRETSEVQHADVLNLQIDQNIVERIFGIGDIAISSAGQGDIEIRARGVPGPERVADIIRQHQ